MLDIKIHNFLIFVCVHVVCVPVFFAPCFIQNFYFRWESLPLFNSILTEQYCAAIFHTIIIGIPMGIDVFLDYQYEKSWTWLARLFLLFALIAPNSVLYSSILQQIFDVNSATHYPFAEWYQSSACFRQISGLVFVLELLSIRVSERKIQRYPSILLSSLLLTYCAAQFLLLYAYSPIIPLAAQSFMNVIGIILIAMAYLQFVYLIGCWCYSVYVEFISKAIPLTSEDISISVALFGLVITSAGILVVNFLFDGSDPRYMSSTCISADAYVQIVFSVIMITLPGRVATREAAALQRLMDGRTAFIRYISHQIRTPLNTVMVGLNYVDISVNNFILRFGKARMKLLAETVVDIKESSESAIDILDELCAFNTLQKGKLNIEMEFIKPIKFITEAVRPFKISARSKGITFGLELVGTDSGWARRSKARIDESKFAQVLRNLISNAFKFTPEGGSVTVKVSMREKDVAVTSSSHSRMLRNIMMGSSAAVAPTPGSVERVLCIEVIDDGAGISKDNLKKMFGQYVQFEAAKLQKGKGSGLGLWISKGIVTMHGGNISADSRGLGLGCTFTVEIPLLVSEEPESLDDAMKSERSHQARADQRSVRLLISSSQVDVSVILSPRYQPSVRIGPLSEDMETTNNGREGAHDSTTYPEAELSFLEHLAESSKSFTTCHSHSSTQFDQPTTARSGKKMLTILAPIPQYDGLDSSTVYSNPQSTNAVTSEEVAVGQAAAAALVDKVQYDNQSIVGDVLVKQPCAQMEQMFKWNSRSKVHVETVAAVEARPCAGDLHLHCPEHNCNDMGAGEGAEEYTRPSKPCNDHFHDTRSCGAKTRCMSGESDGLPSSSPRLPIASPRGLLRWDAGLHFLVVTDSDPNRAMIKGLLQTRGHRVTESIHGEDFLRIMEAYKVQKEGSGSDQDDTIATAAAPPIGEPVITASVDSELAEDCRIFLRPKKLTLDVASSRDCFASPFDVVLIDSMAGMSVDGPRAVRTIRAAGFCGLIFGLVGNIHPEDAEHFLEQGVTALLTKPFHIESIKNAITRAIYFSGENC